MTVKKDMPPIQGILWDLDNTLYYLDEALETAFNIAVARAAIEHGIDISLDDAISISQESFRTHRYSGYEFMTRYNIPQRDIHFMTDRHLDHSLVQKCEETCRLFACHALDHALITHSARPWALGIIERLGLKPWFPDHRVFAFENYDFESKSRSRRPFEMALSAINRNPENVMMVEDTLDNLKVPHEMGMKTVFIHHGRVPDSLPGFVHYHCANARELLETMRADPEYYSKASG
jgi:putative hydrolase of the HAD superfamily